MKFLILALSLLSAQAHAERPVNMNCLSAGGYYGSLQALTRADGRIEVTAAQGFALEISEKLGMSHPKLFSEIKFVLDQKNCTQVPLYGYVLRCSASGIQVGGKDGNYQPTAGLRADVVLHVARTIKNGSPLHDVTLAVRPVPQTRVGTATVSFWSGQFGGPVTQGCRFK